MKSLSFILLFYILILFGCKDISSHPTPSEKQFALYLLNDGTITASRAWTMPQDSLVLAPVPFVTQNDIKSYTWSTHTFFVQPSLDSILGHMSMQVGKSGGVPFFATVGNERVYLGAFWWYYSSSMSQVSYIYMNSLSPHQIKHESLSLYPDLRNDQRIYHALKAAGILVE